MIQKVPNLQFANKELGLVLADLHFGVKITDNTYLIAPKTDIVKWNLKLKPEYDENHWFNLLISNSVSHKCRWVGGQWSITTNKAFIYHTLPITKKLISYYNKSWASL